MKTLISLLFLFSVSAHGAIDPLVDAGDRKQVGSAVLASALKSSDAKMRVRAAYVLGRLQDSRALDPLLSLLQDSDFSVREAAAFNVGQYGWKAVFARESELTAALLPLTADSDLRVRVAAVEALGKVGLSETPRLVLPFLSDSSPLIREKAAFALARYRMVLKLRAPESEPAELAQPAMDALLKLLSDTDVGVRRAATYFFVRTADSRGESRLAALSRESDEWVRFFALTGLGKMKAKKSLSDLVRALKDSKYQNRLAALNALIASSEKIGAYKEMAKDRSWHVRAAFAKGLNPSDGKEAALLRRMLSDDRSVSVKTEALKTLSKDPHFAPQLFTFLRNNHWQLREAAVQSSSVLPEAQREAFLAQGFSDSNKMVKVAALTALAEIPTATAFARIKQALTSEELSLRATAVAALGERKEPETVALAWQTFTASKAEKWIEVRQEIVGILAKQTSAQSLQYLRDAVKDPDPSVGVMALEALIKRGEKNLPAPALPSQLTFSPFRDLTFNDKAPIVVFQTNKGLFKVKTYPEAAPVHVANLVGQVRAGLYNGLQWHRVVSNFVVQGGDPDGSGYGDAGYSMRIEVNRIPFERGVLGMPRSSGFDTGGVQLFFGLVPTPHLDGLYTVFGTVIHGVEVLDQLERGDKIIRARIEM